MQGVAAFFVENLVYVYFFYGLAFFSMGLAVMLESRQASELSLARGAWLLSAFGIIHGGHEWVEMFVLVSGQTPSLTLEWVRVALLASSFLFLAGFGVRIMPYGQQNPRFAARMTILAVVAYVLQVALVRVTFRAQGEEWALASDVLARYSLGIPAGVLTSLALIRQRRAFDLDGGQHYGRGLVWAAAAFALYSIIGQCFAPRSIIFPSMFVNSGTFLALAGFPIQVLRASMAIVMAFSIIRALRAFEAESQLRLDKAREAERRGQQMLAQLNRELQTAARELSLLYEASRLLTTPLDLETLLQEAIAKIVTIVDPIKSGAIMAETGGAVPMRYTASYGYIPGTKPLMDRAEAIPRVVADLSDLSPMWVSDTGEDVTERVSGLQSSPSQSAVHAIRYVALPLQTRDSVMGFLVLETDPDGPYLSSVEAPTINALAGQVAVAIENAALLHETRLRDARRGELLQRITAAQEAERQRIARELHDETGQALTGLGLGLASLIQLIQSAPQQAVAQVTELREMCTRAIDELRHLINYLRPSQLDDLGLITALRSHVEQMKARTPAELSFEVLGTPRRLPPEAETTLFRIAQEGLNNVVKHASAGHASLRLEFLDDELKLYLRDDGRGFDVSERLRPGAGLAWGLLGIQERASLAGGKLAIKSTPGQGTCLELTIPCPPLDTGRPKELR